MTDEQSKRMETITQIPADQLRAGGYLFQLPDTATEEDLKDFNETLKAAQEKGLNFTVQSGVKVIDTRAKETPTEDNNKVEISKPEEKKEEPKQEEPEEPKKDEPSTPQEPAAPQQVQPQVPPQPIFYGPNPPFQYGNQPYQYNPFVGQNGFVQPQATTSIITPQYNPQQITPVGAPEQPKQGYPTVFPNPGFYYVPPQQPQQPTNQNSTTQQSQ